MKKFPLKGLDSIKEQTLLTIFEKQHLKAVDKWIAAQGDPSIDRHEAIRRLVEIGLMQAKRGSGTGRK